MSPNSWLNLEVVICRPTLLEVGRLPSRYALKPCDFTPWLQVSGRLEPAKVVEEENKYDRQVRNCRGLAT